MSDARRFPFVVRLVKAGIPTNKAWQRTCSTTVVISVTDQEDAMRRLAVLVLAAFSIVASTRPAEAVPIAFTTTGTFSAPTGDCTAAAANTITCAGYTLTFSSIPTVEDVPFGFSSVVNFGQVTTTGSSPTL